MFPGWTKIGCTSNPAKRLGTYNTGDPDRAYRMLVAVETRGQRLAEWLAHTRLRRLGYDRKGEWFEVAPALAERVVRRAVAQADEEFSAA